MNSTARSNDKNLRQLLAPPYARIFMYEVETEFLKSEELQPLLWLRYINKIIFIWIHGEEKLTQFLNEFNNFHFYLTFTYETSSGTVNFLDPNVSLRNGAIHTDLYIKPTDSHQYLHYQYSTLCTLRPQYHIVKH